MSGELFKSVYGNCYHIVVSRTVDSVKVKCGYTFRDGVIITAKTSEKECNCSRCDYYGPGSVHFNGLPVAKRIEFGIRMLTE